jgi:hypothetical protein
MRGDVGIFWAYQGKLIISAVPVAEGVDDGTFINGPDDHLPFWSTVQRQHPALRRFTYEEIPRGRALFSKPDQTFYVYMDKVLFTKTIRQAILRTFHLPPRGTSFHTDLHYTTDPQDLEQLFSS